MTVNGETFTGTLIARDYVLTAGHVAARVPPGNIRFNLNVGGNLTRTISATAVFSPPDYKEFNPANPTGDLAIIRLAEPAPAGVPVYHLYQGALSSGTTLTLVGYGASGNGDSGVTVGSNPAVKRVGKNTADILRPSPASGRPAVYYFDFDGPDLSANVFGDGTLGNTIETSVAGGDSGGPAFIRDRSGHLWLAGVNTFWTSFNNPRPPGTFGSGGGGVLLSGYAAWIKSVIAAGRVKTPSR